MKKTEAISILATSVRPREAKDRARYDEAVRIAIEALKCSETPKSSEQNAETAQADHTADIGKKVSISCGQENDLISRQAAIDAMKDMYRAAEKWLRDATDDVTKARAESCMATLVEIKLRIDKTMGKGTLTDDDCMEAAKSVLGEDELPAVQPEIIRCKDCKHKHVENMIWTCPFGLSGGENFFCGYGTEPYKGE